jgi:transcriptional regulator with XRE-family HTH domain
MPNQGVSKEIKKLMTDAGYLSQIELAEAAEMTPQAISNLIRHGVDKHPRNAERLADFFGVDVNDLKPQRKKSETNQKTGKDTYFTESRGTQALGRDSRRTYIDEMKEENRHLRQGDVCIYAGCSLPLEFDIDLAKLRQTIADALKEGAHFHYVFPDETYISALLPGQTSDPSLMRQMKSQIQPAEIFSESMAAFRESLNTKHGVSSDILRSQISLHPSHDPLILNPLYCIYSYIHRDDSGEPRLYLSIKEGAPGSPVVAPDWFHPEIRQAGLLLDRLRASIDVEKY